MDWLIRLVDDIILTLNINTVICKSHVEERDNVFDLIRVYNREYLA